MIKNLGTIKRPRLAVRKSNKNISAQLIDDINSVVIAGVSTLNSEIKKKKFKRPLERSRQLGKLIAAEAKKNKIETVVFDRGRFKYHGNIKEVADGAREGGLKF
ncbi:MAG: 50S ribosomal protein L18 [Elusimicrobia bacterium]|jgi:large subunit ribosomal protein L18|nr:50S ribosomal protein L18 [Elusimicrobiota bacterium]